MTVVPTGTAARVMSSTADHEAFTDSGSEGPSPELGRQVRPEKDEVEMARVVGEVDAGPVRRRRLPPVDIAARDEASEAGHETAQRWVATPEEYADNVLAVVRSVL